MSVLSTHTKKKLLPFHAGNLGKLDHFPESLALLQAVLVSFSHWQFLSQT
jgi:hypothetical protein